MSKKIRSCPKPKTKQSYIAKKLEITKNREFYFPNEWVADFETITKNTKYYQTHKHTGLVYGYMENLEFDIDYEFNDIKDLFKFFFNRNNDQVVYFHNLSFDGVFILDWLGRNNFKLSHDDTIGDNKTFRTHRTTGNKIYMIDVSMRNKKGKIITIFFRCSYHILQKGVNALGKDIGMDKYEQGQENNESFYDREPCESVEEFKALNLDYCLYCQRDVKIVKKCLKDFYLVMYEFLNELNAIDHFNGLKRCITIAAISLKLQIIMSEILGYKAESDLYITDHKSWEIMNKFTNGGLTTANEDYREQLIKENGYIIDLKSAYPAVMSGGIPIGQMIYEKPMDFDHTKYCVFYEIKYDHIVAKNHNIPLLKSWEWDSQTKKLDLHNYTTQRYDYVTCLLHEEMQVLEQLHEFENKQILNTYYFKKEVYLTQFIEKMFYYKEYYKQVGKHARSHAFKIGVNAAYGIHAKRPDYASVKHENWDWSSTKRKYERNERIDLNKKTHHAWIPNNKQAAFNPIDIYEWGSYSHKGIANYITAMTRVKLMKGIIHFGPDKFLYSDTDSLFLINVTKEQVDSYCGSGLGNWEIEKAFDQAQVLRAKLYDIYKDGKIIKQGAAGFKGKDVDMKHLVDHRYQDIENAIKVAVRVDGGLIIESLSKRITINDKRARKQMEKYTDKKSIEHKEFIYEEENKKKE